MITTENIPSKGELLKKVEELAANWGVNIEDVDTVISGVLSQLNVENIQENLPFKIEIFNGKQVLDEVINQFKTDIQEETFYTVFKNYIKETKEKGEFKLEKESSLKSPYLLGIEVPINDTSDADFDIESIKLSTQSDLRDGFKSIIKTACDKEFTTQDSVVIKKITADEKDHFFRFIVGYYDALAENCISDSFEALSDNKKLPSVKKYQKDELVQDLLEAEQKVAEPQTVNDSSNTYAIEISLKVFSYSASLNTSFKGKKFSEFKGTFSNPIALNEVVSKAVPSELQKELPNQVEKKSEKIVEFTFAKDDKAIIIWFEALSFKLGLGLKDKHFVYLGFEMSKDEKGNYVAENAMDEGLKFLRINKVNLLYKKDAKTKVKYDFEEGHKNSDINLFNKNFLNDYNLIVGANVNLDEIDAFKKVSKSFNIKTIGGYLALSTQQKGKAAMILNVDEVGDEAFKINDFSLSAFINKGSKDFGIAIGGVMTMKLDDKGTANSILKVHASGKITATGFYISASMDNNYTIRLTDSLSLKELGILVGYDSVTQLALGFQGRIISNDENASASIYAATHLNIIGQAVKVNMFSLAIAPGGNDPVRISELLSNMFGVPQVMMHPALHLISIGDILVKRVPNSSNTSLWNANESKENIVAYFNKHIEKDLNISDDDLDSVGIVPLNAPKTTYKNFLVTDHSRKIHYKIDYMGNLFLNSQLYFCINETKIGGTDYKTGVFAAVLLSILGQEVKFLLKIENDFNLEGYASMSPVDLAGLLTIKASKKAAGYNNSLALEKNNGLFKQVMANNTNASKGPELYLKMSKPSLYNKNFELKTHGNVTLLHLFEADAFVYIGDKTIVDFACKILNANLAIKYLSQETATHYETEFSLAFQTEDFSNIIKDIQNKISNTVGNTKQKLEDAKRKLREEEVRLSNERDRARRDAEARYNRMSRWERFWHNLGNFIEDAIYAVGKIASRFTEVIIDVVGFAIEVGGWAFNRLLDAVDAIVSLIGKIISLNKLYIKSKANINKVNPELNFNLEASIDLSFFGRRVDTSFNFNFNFKPNVDLFKAVADELTKKVSDVIWNTEEYKRYVSAGKDEKDPVTFNKINANDFVQLTEDTDKALEKVHEVEEHINYLKNIFNNPLNLESYVKENDLTEKDVEKVMDLINGNSLDLLSEINAINATITSKEFQEKFDLVKEEIKSSDVVYESNEVSKEEVLDTFNVVDNGIKLMFDRINKADAARKEMLIIRSEERNKNIEILDKYVFDKKQREYNNISKKLRAGEGINLSTKLAKDRFNEYILQLTDMELIQLATEALEKMYINKVN